MEGDSVPAGAGIGGGAGPGHKSGHNDLRAWCYGGGIEGLRCYHGILRGFSQSACPVLRQPSPQGGIEGRRKNGECTSLPETTIERSEHIRSEERRVGKECRSRWS